MSDTVEFSEMTWTYIIICISNMPRTVIIEPRPFVHEALSVITIG